jgi:hypothetical protein
MMYDKKKHYERVWALVGRVAYRDDDDYVFKVGETEGMKYPFIQLQHYRRDAITGEWGWGAGGKAYITQHATDSEIFQTMIGLAKSYEEHEVREHFLVDGARVFGPHIDTMALKEIAERVDVRS